MKKTLLSAALMIAATMSFAQKVQVVTAAGQTYTYDISSSDQVIFVPEEEAIAPAEGVQEVDLGLPSGTKWANMNIGASSETGYGVYFMWGYTYDCSDDACSSGTCDTYNIDMDDWQGNATYDAAAKNWGGSWVTPTATQVQELIDECTWTWTTENNVKGYKVTSKTDTNISIFIPAAGRRYESKFYDQGSTGWYWSSTPNTSKKEFSRNLFIPSNQHIIDAADTGGDWRNSGFPIRPVISGTGTQAE